MKLSQNGTRNTGRSDHPKSDNEILNKYEVLECDYEV